MRIIDGSMGEGGGQVLRSALTLSLLTGEDVEIHAIRAGRSRPGLRPQHLAAVQAAAAVGRAEVKGARQGSQALFFRPKGLFAGDYRCDIGTAGSTSLVLQTLALPLLFADAPSTVSVTGGTHVPWSPCFHYLERHWCPLLRTMGYPIDIDLQMAGFYPRGGGAVTARIAPHGRLAPLDLRRPGALRRVSGMAAVAGLPEAIAERMQRRSVGRLRDLPAAVDVGVEALATASPGCFLMLCAEFEHSRACFVSLGKRGKPAEKVADDCIDALRHMLACGAAVDAWVADQLLLPLALVPGRSLLHTERVTRHLLTLCELVGRFLDAAIEVEGGEGEPGLVRIDGTHPARRQT